MKKFLADKKYYFTILILALLYFSLGKVSLILLKGYHIINVTIFPSEGIALAFAIYFGKRVWPGIFLGAFILALSNSINLLSSFEIATISSLEAIIGVYLFRKYQLNKELKSFKDLLLLAFMIIFILQVFSAFLSNAALLVNSVISKNMFFKYVYSWWFGNVMGQLLFTPFTLLFLVNYKKINLIDFFMHGIIFIAILYLTEIQIAIDNILLLLIITVPFAIFIVSKKGSTYGMLFSILLAYVSAFAFYFNKGVFVSKIYIDSAIDYNLFVMIHIITVMITSILFEKRKELETVLHKKIEAEVSKNKQQQILMMQQSRLAQMGEMIAMIAHQWRQPLNNLSLANQLLVLKYEKGQLDDKTMEYFKNNSKKQINNMSETIDVFRDFFKSRKTGQIFYINDTVNSILDMTRAIFMTKGIKISFNDKKPYAIFGYPNDLGQVLLNIINNAKDALMLIDKKNKYINIKIEEKNDKIIICIADNAGGIKEEIKDKIFDPYFSTKDEKNGTGLGLYMSKMIVEKKFNGKIDVINSNEGTIFKIFLKREQNAK